MCKWIIETVGTYNNANWMTAWCPDAFEHSVYNDTHLAIVVLWNLLNNNTSFTVTATSTIPCVTNKMHIHKKKSNEIEIVYFNETIRLLHRSLLKTREASISHACSYWIGFWTCKWIISMDRTTSTEMTRLHFGFEWVKDTVFYAISTISTYVF